MSSAGDSNADDCRGHDVAVRLEFERRQVLDLSARNRLLNYRGLRSRGVRVVDERADAVFDLLVEHGKALQFLDGDGDATESTDRIGPARGASPEAFESSEPFESTVTFRQPALLDLGSREVAARHRDALLQTPYTDAELQRRLLNTYYATQRILQEQGVNTLFLALGFLEWHDDRTSEFSGLRRAPLILIPISIARASASSRFQIEYTGKDIGTNLSLAEKLKADFNLVLPEWSEDTTVVDYLRDVSALSGMPPDWKIAPDIALDFFSYTRYQIYQDLDPIRWCDRIEAGAGAVGRLIGSESYAAEFAPPYDAESDLDDTIKAEDIIHVVDADSSQMVAIRRVLDGRDLIIQGPPGTGKSQTITNIIAACVVAGKRVLFVAEKQAALDVVFNNLRKVGLERLALRLHSNRSSKNEMLKDLEQTLHSRPSGPGERSQALRAMRRFRQTLRDYSDTMKSISTGFGASVASIVSTYSVARGDLAGFEAPQPTSGEYANVTADELEEVALITADVQALLAGDVGLPIDHPFWGTGLEIVLQSFEVKLDALCTKTLAQLDDVAEIAETLERATKGAVGDRLADLWVLSGHATAVDSCPHVSGWSFDPEDWAQDEARRKTIIRVGERVRETFARLGDKLLPDAWTRDIRKQEATVSRHHSSIFRFFRSDYRRAIRQLQALFRGTPPKDMQTLLEFARLIVDYQGLTDSIRDAPETLGRVFGESWKGVHSDFAELVSGTAVAEGVVADVAAGRVSPESIRFLNSRSNVVEAARVAQRLIPALEEAEIGIQDLYDALKFPPLEYDDVKSLTRPDLHERVRTWKNEIGRLNHFVGYVRLRAKLKDRGLHSLAAAADTWPYAKDRLTEFARYSWANDAYQAALGQYPELREFSREVHERAIDKFGKTDVALLRENRFIVAREHKAGMPHYPAGQLDVLRREFVKSRRHKPVRQLMAQAGGAVQRIKPLFMMSPLSVATYLPPGAVEFDLVVFDEASQIKPIDAFGAILRSNQVVVVGDKQQLPPTTFFEVDAMDSVADTGVDEEHETIAELESILGLASARGCPSSMLTWHYRSRHESLISVSNDEFYDSRLKVFPTPLAARGKRGLQFRLVPGSFYEPGKGRRCNAGEAKAVALRVLKHARKHPGQSIGITTFGSGQRDQILDELEQLRRESAEIDTFDLNHPDEPIFVKNLENVQGDERDVIFISVGYGKRADGGFSHNFGPVNQAGGERRLNVLFTRARERCVVFANFTHDDIDLDRSQSRGVAVLKRFLRHAEQHSAARIAPDGAGRGTFAESLAAGLTARGYLVDQGVGVPGLRVDIAIRHRSQPARYVIGIQCDGPDYHAAQWTRVRDRLRVDGLDKKGWVIHRVWSPDWYRAPDLEMDRIGDLMRAAEEQGDAVRDADKRSGTPQLKDVYEVGDPGDASVAIAEAYRTWEGDAKLGEIAVPGTPIDLIADIVTEIVATESPVHMDEVVRRIRDRSGAARAGSAIRSTVEVACERARNRRTVTTEDAFLWNGSVKQTVPVRNRSALADESRQVEYIHDNEIATAFHQVVLGTGGINTSDAVREVRRLLGYGRSTTELDAKLTTTLERVIAEGLLVERDGMLSV